MNTEEAITNRQHMQHYVYDTEQRQTKQNTTHKTKKIFYKDQKKRKKRRKLNFSQGV